MNDVFRAKNFWHQTHCSKHRAIASLKLLGCGNSEDKQPIRTVWKCFYVTRHVKTFKGTKIARLVLVINWIGPLQTVTLPFSPATTYGLFMLRYIAFGAAATTARRHNFPFFPPPLLCPLCMTEPKLKLRSGTSGLPRKMCLCVWKRNVECSRLNHCRYYEFVPLGQLPVESLEAAAATTRVFTLRFQGGKVPIATDLNPN